jgi:hypothetical protein
MSEFESLLKEVVHERRFVRLQYFTPNHEFLRTDTLLRQMDGDHIELASGERVSVDRIFSVNDTRAPQYAGEEDFSCDC